METRFVHADDGTRLAYDCQGDGPGLLLLHGMPEGRRQWHDLGYVARLRPHFTVVTPDVRGFGESDTPATPDAYAVEILLADVARVAAACRLERFAVWGYSFGAILGLHLAARSPLVTRAVIAGTHFGRAMTAEVVARSVAQAEEVARAKDAGRLDALPLTPAQRAVAARIDIPAHIACLRAMAAWPPIAPRELHCPAFVYAGAADAEIAGALEAQRAEIAAAGIALHVFADLTHDGELRAVDTILPPALEFLRG
ncbi:MAG TPA: alpha/beta hydrolase [Thermomicrobiales bacterium]|nr:alpha/beta hydrolase [Thermomicrobiales bacterium]